MNISKFVKEGEFDPMATTEVSQFHANKLLENENH